jgi:hypothetical protein
MAATPAPRPNNARPLLPWRHRVACLAFRAPTYGPLPAQRRVGDPKVCASEPKLCAEALKLTDGSRAFLVGLSFDVGDQSGEVR